MILRDAVPAEAEARPSAIATSLASMERRFARRKTVMTNGQIVSPDVTVPLSCMVRDVSTTGARIELVTAADNPLGGRARLPGTFTLVLRMDRVEVDCAIAWRNGALVGVRYLSTPRPQVRAPR